MTKQNHSATLNLPLLSADGFGRHKPPEVGATAGSSRIVDLMMDSCYGLNAVDVGGGVLLLLVAGGGDAIHLTRETASQSASRSAVPAYYFKSSRHRSRLLKRNYDRAALMARRWAETTLCGRHWVAMALAGDGDSDDHLDDAAIAPTCRRCLELMDKYFPEPRRAARFTIVAEVVTDLVVARGYAELCDVPGDQQAALRKHVRAEVTAADRSRMSELGA